MRSDASMPAADLTRAVGALLLADPKRITALVASLRGPDRVIESTIEGMSMGQSLPPGARIRIELVERTRYDTGTVIAFLVGAQVVVHRVVHRGLAGKAAGLMLTRGDAPCVPDEPVTHAQILGPVTGVLRDGRWDAPHGAPRRSLRARIVSATLLLGATALLYLSPRATARLLARLHRWEGVVRNAKSRRFLRREPVPPRST